MSKELRSYRFDAKTIEEIEKIHSTLGVDRTEAIKRSVNTFLRLIDGDKNDSSFTKGVENTTVHTVKDKQNGVVQNE